MAVNQIVEFQAFGAAEDAFEVITMKAVDEISTLFRYEMELVTKTPNLPFDDLMAKTARIGLKQVVTTGDGSKGSKLYNIYGMLASFEQLEKQSDQIRCRAVVVPRLWKTGQTFLSRIFQDKDVVTILDEILKDKDGYDLKEKDDYTFEKITRADYKARTYVVQYQESDFAFLSRWLEHEGISYRFEMNDERERLVLMDKLDSYADIAVKLKYRPGGEKVSKDGSPDVPDEEVVYSLTGRQKPGPAKVALTDWNYRTPDVDLKAEAVVSDTGKGTVYEHGNHYKTQDEGKALAEIRAQAIKCGLKEFDGSSNCRSIRAGAVIEIAEHYRSDFNGKYLITSVRHKAQQPAGLMGQGSNSKPKYENTFSCIPSTLTYRPPRLTPWPRLSGVTTALIDGDSAEKYGPLDENGEYRLKMDFDRSDPTNGKSSRPVRMSQPQAGAGYGVHYPQHLKTEVLVVHKDGNPDRPMIVGAVPNPKTPSPVKGENKSQLIFKSSRNNALVFEDKEGEEDILLQAEKNHDVRVKAVKKEWVGGEKHLIVEDKHFEHFKKEQHRKIDEDCKEDFAKALNVAVGGDYLLQVTGDYGITIKKGLSVKATDGIMLKGATINLSADEIVLEAKDKLTLKVGGNNVVIDSGGVTICGQKVTVDSSTVAIASGSGSGPGSVSLKDPEAPATPDKPLEAGTVALSGAAAGEVSGGSSSGGVPEPGSAPAPSSGGGSEDPPPPVKPSSISIELVDDDGKPVKNERFEVKLPDGTTVTGFLDDNGKAMVDSPTEGQCEVSFPDLDKDEWKDA